jgi:hypothetical protein
LNYIAYFTLVSLFRDHGQKTVSANIAIWNYQKKAQKKKSRIK